MISYDDFAAVDIRIGTITRAEPFPEARKPAIKLWVDFGGEIGEKRSSAQITAHYTPEGLIGRQVLAVVNFPPRQIGKVMSEVLVLGVPDAAGEAAMMCQTEASCFETRSFYHPPAARQSDCRGAAAFFTDHPRRYHSSFGARLHGSPARI